MSRRHNQGREGGSHKQREEADATLAAATRQSFSLAITLDALEVSLWQGDADVQIFALTALVRLVGSGRVRLTHHPECAPILVRILRRHVHPDTRQEFAKLASVTPSDVEEYDERSRELMEKAAAVKIFWDAMSQSDGV